MMTHDVSGDILDSPKVVLQKAVSVPFRICFVEWTGETKVFSGKYNKSIVGVFLITRIVQFVEDVRWFGLPF